MVKLNEQAVGRGAAFKGIDAGAPADATRTIDGEAVFLETDIDGLSAGGLFGVSSVFPQGPAQIATINALDIADTTLDALYRQERFSPGSSFGYQIPLANGVYDIDFYFAELFFGVLEDGGVGDRTFDVYAEDVLSADDLDLFAEAGAATEVVVTRRVRVEDGSLTLRFERGVENPKVDAIVVYEVDTAAVGPNQAPIDLDLDGATVVENAVGATIGRLTVADLDDTAHTLTVNDPRFTVTAQGDLRLADGVALDFEAGTSVRVLVTATDSGGLSITKRFRIAVENVDDGFDPFAGVPATDPEDLDGVGAVIVAVTADDDDVQASSDATASFTVTNVGDKRVAGVFIDLDGAVFPDLAFDPLGEAGDTAGKPLTLDAGGGTGALNPASYTSTFGPGGADGFDGLLLRYDLAASGGFENGESMSFSIDVDPLSLNGFSPALLANNSAPAWFPGGVSGAEMIGATVTVLFSDGSRASGALFGDRSQAGAQALVSEDVVAGDVALTVNGLEAGETGTYGGVRPRVVVSGPEGAMARIVMIKGFVQPAGGSVGGVVANRLMGADFAANNAVEVQTVDVLLGARPRDVSFLFDFADTENGVSFAGDDLLDVAFVAAVIDPQRDGVPIGAVSDPIYLANNGTAAPALPGDRLFADDSGERLVGDATVTQIFGGAGDDTLIDRDGDNRVSGGAGDDTIATGDGDDVLKGDDGADDVTAGGGDDVILGGDGNDVLRGGDGNDVIKGGPGDDRLDGGAGNDTILGSDGADTIIGGTGNDIVKTGRGEDVVTAGSGADIVFGFRGNERLDGGTGNDRLLGNLGDDTLIGGAGDDRMGGGPGRDRFLFREANFGDDRIIDFRIGSDTLQFTAESGVDGLSDLAFRQVGGNALIAVVGGTSSVVLGGVDVDDLLARADEAFLF